MTGTDTTPPQAPPPRLTRDRAGGQWLGVAAGLGRYLRLDPVIPRVAFVVLTFVGGLGILLYLALWLVMPEEHETTTPGETAAQRLRDAPTWLSVALIVLGVLWFAGAVGFSGPGLVWGLALVGLGILLFQQDGARQTATRAAAVPPPPPPAGGQTPAPPPPSQPSAALSPPAPAPPAEPPEPPSILGRLIVGVALLVIGGAALLANTTAASFGPRTYLALALVVIGGGLLVGAWWGRARWMIAVGLLLLPLALATGIGGLPAIADANVGNRHWQPQTMSELSSDYSLFAGEAVLDLTDLDLSGEPTTTVTGNVAFGQFTVLVPDDVDVTVRGSVIAGEVVVFGTADSGLFVDVGRGTSTAGSDLVLELRGGFGQMNVVQPNTENRSR